MYFTGLGLTGKQVGWFSILSPVMMMVLAPVVALIADRRHSRRRFAQVALAGRAISVFLLRLPTTFAVIALLMFSIAIFNSPLMSLVDSLIARMAQRHNLNYAGIRLWRSFGCAVSAVAYLGYILTSNAKYLPVFSILKDWVMDCGSSFR